MLENKADGFKRDSNEIRNYRNKHMSELNKRRKSRRAEADRAKQISFWDTDGPVSDEQSDNIQVILRLSSSAITHHPPRFYIFQHYSQ